MAVNNIGRFQLEIALLLWYIPGKRNRLFCRHAYFIFLAMGQHSFHIDLCPFRKLFDQRKKRFTDLCKTVFDFRRYHGIYFSVYKAIGLQCTQCGGKHSG